MVPYKDVISTQLTDLESRVEITGPSSQPGISFPDATPATLHSLAGYRRTEAKIGKVFRPSRQII